MKDFEGNELNVGDEVIFAYNKFKSTKLSRGIIKELGVKQFGMTVAVIERNGESSSRCSPHNIHKVG